MNVTVENVALEVVAAYVSKNRVTIEERLKNITTEKKISRLKKSTGFEAFSISDQKTCSSDYCAAAAEKLFVETSVKREEIAAVIFVTQTPDYIMPATSHILHNRLGLKRDCAAFDINLGCSGFVYGVYIAASLAQNLNGKVLLLCGDTITKNVFEEDISGLSIFGDAGSAAIVSKHNGQKMFFNIQTYGELADSIIMRRGAYRNPLIVENNSLNLKENFASMDGTEVMKFSTTYVPDNLIDLMNFAKVELPEIGGVILHQANLMIIRDIAARLNLTLEKVPLKSARIGNTSCASIPVTLCEMKRLGENVNFLAALSGFGVGMSLASAIVDLKNLICLPTGEI